MPWGALAALPWGGREPCPPLAMIAEACGGLATDGQRNTLDIVPRAFDQRAPFYFGSRREIEMAHKFLAAG